MKNFVFVFFNYLLLRNLKKLFLWKFERWRKKVGGGRALIANKKNYEKKNDECVWVQK